MTRFKRLQLIRCEVKFDADIDSDDINSESNTENIVKDRNIIIGEVT